MIDMDSMRRISHKIIQFNDPKKSWVYTMGAAKWATALYLIECAVKYAAMSFWTPTKVSDGGNNSGYPACRFCSDHLGLKTISILVSALTQRQ